MLKTVITIIIILTIATCASRTYRLPDKPKGALKPQYSEYDVRIQEELVEGWRIKCIKSKMNEILCDNYKREHQYLQNFYYDAEESME